MHPFIISWLGSCEAPNLAYFSNPRPSLLLSWYPALQLNTTVENPKSTVLPYVSIHRNKRQETTWSWMNRENYLGSWFSTSWFQTSWDPAGLPTPEFCEINTPVILSTNPFKVGLVWMALRFEGNKPLHRGSCGRCGSSALICSLSKWHQWSMQSAWLKIVFL